MTDSSFFNFPVYDVIEDGQSYNDISRAKDVLIFIEKATYGEQEKDLLKKILASIHLNSSEIKPLLLDREQRVHLSFVRSLDKKMTIFLFGILPEQIGVNIDHRYYKFYSLYNWKVIKAHNLKELAININAKKALWAALKNCDL